MFLFKLTEKKFFYKVIHIQRWLIGISKENFHV
ncbi:hypothetical protein Herod_00102 [Acinetobacter phage Herod]|nr:hypothetical protein Herod_00102 [Acinetobacter phage Herod]